MICIVTDLLVSVFVQLFAKGFPYSPFYGNRGIGTYFAKYIEKRGMSDPVSGCLLPGILSVMECDTLPYIT